jgi:Lrp/AsnC family transcriptional regulator for asnA, asnC and gidA
MIAGEHKNSTRKHERTPVKQKKGLTGQAKTQKRYINKFRDSKISCFRDERSFSIERPEITTGILTGAGGKMKRINSMAKRKIPDTVDCQMIELLQKDGRISNTDIAKRIGISEATVRTRLNRLIKEKFIQIVAVSDPIKLGFEIVGNIRIHVDIRKMDQIIKELQKLKPLWFIVQTTGGTGIDTEFVVKSLDELNELIFEEINKIDGIIRTETTLFLKYIKRQYAWGTALP